MRDAFNKYLFLSNIKKAVVRYGGVRLRTDSIDADRWERSRRIDWLDLDSIASARVLVVGAGALGNEAIKDLVLSGVRRVDVVDMDRVVRSNLNRCVFFREEDASGGELKAEVVARRAMELDPGAEVRPLVCRVEELPEDVWRSCDVVLGCLDNIAARLHVNSHACYFGKVYIDGGTRGTTGKVQVVSPPSTPCVQCAANRTHYRTLDMRHSCTGSDMTFFQPKFAAEITTTAIIAAMQVREALKILSGQGDRCLKHVALYDGLGGRWEEMELSLDPSCPNHSAQQRIC